MHRLKSIKLYFFSILKLSFLSFRNYYFRSDFYNKKLITFIPTRIFYNPSSYLSASLATIGSNFYKITNTLPELLWQTSIKDRQKFENLHGFLWLTKLDRKNSKNITKEIIKSWINNFFNYDPDTWEMEIAAKRIIAKNKYNITDETKNIVCGISASGPTKRWDINNYIKLFENLNLKFKCKFFLAGGPDDEDLIKKVMNSSIGKNCISFAAMDIAETIPIIATCKYCISNDTGFGHISAGLGLQSLMLFIDSPPTAYGLYTKNISILVPEGETIETTTHDTLGTISVDEVLKNALELMN